MCVSIHAVSVGLRPSSAATRYNAAVALFYEDVIAALTDEGVRFVVVGGLAVILHGVPRTTADLDLAVDLDENNVRRLVAVLTRLGFHPRAPVPADDLARAERRREWIEGKGMRAFTFHRPSRPMDEVDVIIDSPVDFARLARNAERLRAEHLVVPIAGAADLIEMKEAAGRQQDVADADALRRLMEDRDRG
jgi:hypothetical protein